MHFSFDMSHTRTHIHTHTHTHTHAHSNTNDFCGVQKVPAGVQLAPIDHYKRAALVTLQKTRISMGKV